MPLPGFKAVKPQVFAGLYPVDSNDYEAFREALAKLRLNDSALHYEPETSQALGFGFRCGFLGMLHMEIVQERLEREYGLNLITTAPTVVHEVLTTGGEKVYVDNPALLPAPNQVAEIREPAIRQDEGVTSEFQKDSATSMKARMVVKPDFMKKVLVVEFPLELSKPL